MEQINGPSGDNECRGALATARFAKNVFLWLIFLCLVIQFSGFMVVRFVGVTEAGGAVEAAASKPAPATATAPAAKPKAPAPKPKAPAPVAKPGQAKAPAPAAEPQAAPAPANTWRAVYDWALPATKFVGLVAGVLLALTLLLSVELALVGRTGGVAGFLSAFLWSLVLGIFLVPWQQALPGSSILCGVLYNLGDLVSATRRVAADDASVLDHLLYYLRFLAYPVFVFLLWLLVQAKFSRGCRRACLGVEAVQVPNVASVDTADNARI